ncbi:MAG: FadR family transcriptional regulator [bacterium]|nr:FadR family transcriptional regulator [bacterium]
MKLINYNIRRKMSYEIRLIKGEKRVDFGEPVTRESVVNIVVNKIKEKLLSGELKPGDRLPSETELSERLGVGRPSIREAIKMLKALGVVTVKHGDGTYISESINENAIDPLIFSLIFQRGESKDLLELRHLFEVGYTKLAIEKLTEEDIADIEKALKKHEDAVKKDKFEELGDRELEFHFAILKATRNLLVIKVGCIILELLRPSIERTTRIYAQRAVEDHKRIFEAIKKKNSLEIEEAIKKSYEVWKEQLKEVYQK